MGQCDLGVARAGNGTATALISMPDGRKRGIFFTNGRAIGAYTTEADGYREFQDEHESDLHRIQIGPERYEIADAVILGG
jgi:hypothetical protein